MARAAVISAERVPWSQPPGHFEAYSKYLVDPDRTDSRHFDFRVSIYQPRGYAAVHRHEAAEQIYYILRGTALVTLDGEPHVLHPHDLAFIPPGVDHGISNSGFEDLVFIVVTSPPETGSRGDGA
jgi:mannose-6-phosphate isomerase-like protein (cupin superfamily)